MASVSTLPKVARYTKNVSLSRVALAAATEILWCCDYKACSRNSVSLRWNLHLREASHLLTSPYIFLNDLSAFKFYRTDGLKKAFRVLCFFRYSLSARFTLITLSLTLISASF